MFGKFEVTAYWRGKRTVRYYDVKLCDGIAMRIHKELESRGFKHIDVRLMPTLG